MVGIFVGAGTGFERGSGAVLGELGLLGQASLGRNSEQVFVNGANGNLLISQRDEFLVGRGPDVAISRTYNSLGDFSDENGDNWRQSTQRRVYGLTGTLNTAGSTVKRVSGDGTEITYAYKTVDSTAAYWTTDGAGAHDRLVRSGNDWIWTDGDSQITEKYSLAYGSTTSWRILETANSDGDKLTFTYLPGGDKLQRVTTADGGYTHYSWTGNFITQVSAYYTDLSSGTAKALTRTRYSYDGYSRLVTATLDLSPEDNSVADSKTYVTSYTYHGESKRVASISQTDGSRLEIDYAQAAGGAYRVTEIRQTVATGVTRTTKFQYGTDSEGSYTDIEAPLNQVTRLRYDGGQLKKIIPPAATDGAPAETVEIEYDAATGDVEKIIQRSGTTNVGETTYELDEWGNVLTTTDPTGAIVVRTYSEDGTNLLLTERRKGSNAHSAEAEHTSRFVYDDEKHLCFTISAEGRVTKFVYSPEGALEKSIRFTGDVYDTSSLDEDDPATLPSLTDWAAGQDLSAAEITTHTYDARGNLVRTTSHSVAESSGIGIDSEGYSQTDFVYNQAGQLLSSVADGRSKESFVYDGLGRAILSTDLNGGTTSVLFEDSAMRTVVTLASGLVKTSLYNRAGELIGSTESSQSNSVLNALLLSDTEGWYLSNASRVPTPDGPLPFMFENDPGEQGHTITAQTRIPAGTTFDLSYTYKPAPNGHQFQLGVQWRDANGLFIGSNIFNEWPTASEYATKTYRITKPAGAVFYNVYVQNAPSAPARWGGVTLTAANHVTNAALVDGTTGWTLSNATRQPAQPGDPLPYLFKTSGTAQGYTISQQSPVPDGTSFDLGYTFRPGLPNKKFTVGVQWRDARGFLIGNQSFNEWVTDVVNFTTKRYQVTRPVGAVTCAVYAQHQDGMSAEWGGISLGSDREGAIPTATRTFSYDQFGRLRIATDATGRSIYHVYDRLGRKVGDINDRGELTEYRYDAGARVAATVRYSTLLDTGDLDALAGALADLDINDLRPASAESDQWTWQVRDKAGRVVKAIEGDGGVTAYAYDKSGRLIATIAYANKLSATQLADLRAVPPTDPELPTADAARDTVARNFYDKDGLLIGALDGEGYLRRIDYDKAGRKVAETAYFNATGTASSVDRAAAPLEGSGSLTASITADSGKDRISRSVYDGRGLLRFEIDSLNQVTEYRYDNASQVTTTIRYNGTLGTPSSYTYGSVKALVTSSGLAALPGARSSWAVYDAGGRVVYAIDAENAVTAFAYDVSGNLIRTTRHGTARATSSAPTLTEMNSWLANLTSPQAADVRVTRSYYNDKGELRFTVDAEGYVNRFDYDAEGRKTGETRWDNKIVVTDATMISAVEALASSSGTAASTSLVYDQSGRLAWSYDGAGYGRSFAYYANGTLQSETRAAGTADESRTVFTYDATGRVATRTDAEGSTAAATTSYAYDGVGNLVQTTDARGNSSYFYYDRLGRDVLRRDAESYLTETAYNAFGEVATVTRRADRTQSTASPTARPFIPTSDADAVTTFAYDPAGRLVAETNALGQATTRTYTAFDELDTVTRGTGTEAATTNFDYDKLSRLTLETDAVSLTTARTYTVFGELKTVTRGTGAEAATTKFEYDRLGRLTKTTDAQDHIESYGLDAFGNRTTVTNKLGHAVTSTYDRRGLLISETLPMSSYNSGGTEIATSVVNKFEYDGRGNRTKSIEAFGLAEQRTTVYVYDKSDRLLETRHDPVSVLSQADHYSTSTVTPTDRLKYDATGNVIESIDANGTRTLFYYDKLGRKTVQIAEATTVVDERKGTYSSFTYDASGNVATSRTYADLAPVPTTAGGTAPTPPGTACRETAYQYDKLGRLTATSVAGLRTGAWNGTWYQTASEVTVTSTIEYDSRGNVKKSIDGNGNTVWSWYDLIDRKTEQVDQENYLTRWTHKADGNVATERRYATKVTGTLTTTAAPAGTVNADHDRVTEFDYDKNGRRTQERRLGVVAWKLDPQTNALVRDAASGETTRISAIDYLYNALGQVVKKTEATGDTVDYTYDKVGRLEKEVRAAYTDQNGVSVTPTTRYRYNGLNDLAFTRTGGAAELSGDRFTRYSYSAGGRLATMTDAAGNQYSYAYDAAGNLLSERYSRQKANATSVQEGLLYTRDLAGRVTEQSVAALNGSTWTRGDLQKTVYNAFGEVSARGVNGLQETFEHDGAGRVWRTNSGDGVWRFFVHDGAGNQTLAIESEGTNLAGMSLDQVLGIATANGVNFVGQAKVNGINPTITAFDKRGMAVQTRLVQRELGGGQDVAAIVVNRGYNAYGELASETDPRNAAWQTDYSYNTMGRLTEKKSPTVSVMGENDSASSQRPTENFYYDISGRLIATRDPNQTEIANEGVDPGSESLVLHLGAKNRRALLAGTGYGGGEALVAAEFRADDGVFRTFHDVFGDARVLRNELFTGSNAAQTDELRTYDALGRLTQQQNRGGLSTSTYTYDLLGQRITHASTASSTTEKTDYDLQGRIVSHTAFGGNVTTTGYAWDGTIATGGMATYGGWTQTTTHANGRTSIEKSDLFGREVSKTDLGGHVFTTSYDLAGRMTERSVSGGETITYSWLNSGVTATVSSTLGPYSTYTYDMAGNRLTEYTTRFGSVIQNATATYDALGRMASWAEAGTNAAVAPAASWTRTYDANGNVRREDSHSAWLNATGAAGTSATGTYWYRFDSMNRMTLEKAYQTNGALVGGRSHEYDKAGQRVKTSWTESLTAKIANPEYPYEDQPQFYYYDYEGERREHYSYDAAGRVTEVKFTESGYSELDGATSPPTPWTVGLFTYDGFGRQTRQTDYNKAGISTYDRTIVYDAKGQIDYETSYTKQGGLTMRADTDHIYGTGTSYAPGTASSITVKNWRNGVDGDALDTSTTTTHGWWDGAVTLTTSHDSNTGSSSNALFTSTYSYSGGGVLGSVLIDDGSDRSVTFVNDVAGQAIRRDVAMLDQYGAPKSDPAPHEVWHRFAGREMAYTGNNGTLDTAYVPSAESRNVSPGTGPFRNGSTSYSAHSDVDHSIDPINSFGQGSAAGSYTARSGDTLAGIAAQLWGDANLWYKLAEANGLSASSTLAEGQNLHLPAGVIRSTHNASTFKPYDAAEAIGDTSPTTPKPQKKNKCGMLGNGAGGRARADDFPQVPIGNLSDSRAFRESIHRSASETKNISAAAACQALEIRSIFELSAWIRGNHGDAGRIGIGNHGRSGATNSFGGK